MWTVVCSPDIIGQRHCYKLFGFEGMLAQKSFKRNRKQYRVTILSLTLSVTLFLSASSFCAYMQSAIGGLAAYAGYTSEDIEYRQDPSDQTDPETRLKALAKAPSVQESAYFRKVNLTFSSKYLHRHLVFKTIDGR